MTLIEYRLTREMWNGSNWIEVHSDSLSDLAFVQKMQKDFDRERPEKPYQGDFGHCWYEQRHVAPWIRL